MLWQKYILLGDLNEGSVDLVHKMGAVVPGLKKKEQHEWKSSEESRRE